MFFTTTRDDSDAPAGLEVPAEAEVSVVKVFAQQEGHFL